MIAKAYHHRQRFGRLLSLVLIFVGPNEKLSERGGRFTKNNAQRDAHYSQKQNVIVTVVDTPRSKARTAPILQHNERMRHLLSKRNLSIARTRQISGDDPMES